MVCALAFGRELLGSIKICGDLLFLGQLLSAKYYFPLLRQKNKSVFEIVQRPRIWAEACVDLTVWEDDWRGSWNIQLGNFICTCSLVLPIHTSPCWHTLIYLLPWAKDIVLFWERFSKGSAVSPWDDGSWLKDSFVHLVMHKASSVSS